MNLYIDLYKAVSQMPNVGTDTPTEDQSVAENEASYAKRPVGVAEGESQDPDSPDVGAQWKHSKEASVLEEVKGKRKERTKEAQKDGTVNKAQPFDGGFSTEEATKAAEGLGIDFTKEEFGLAQFTAGMNVEREHADVSKTAKVIGKIALSHLKETADYYEKLKKVEGESEVSKGLSILKSLNSRLEDHTKSRTPTSCETEFLMELGFTQEEINKGLAIITGRNRSLFGRWLCGRLSRSTEDLHKSLGVDFGR